jgi:hypothetical protein
MRWPRMGRLGHGPTKNRALLRQAYELRTGIPIVSVQREMICPQGIQTNQNHVRGSELWFLRRGATRETGKYINENKQETVR